MAHRSNQSGRPLSATDWLECHHLAKLPERQRFAERIVNSAPKTIVDLGCGPGLWLRELSEASTHPLTLIGLDQDTDSLESASRMLSGSPHKIVLREIDFETEPHSLPSGDIYLAFNIFPYISNAKKFIKDLHTYMQIGSQLIVRQYDGGLLRFGPMFFRDRVHLETVMSTSVGESDLFNHYAMDEVYSLLQDSSYSNKTFEFETFSRFSPFSGHLE